MKKSRIRNNFIRRFRLSAAAFTMFAMIASVSFNSLFNSNASGITDSFIIQLKGDSAAVWKAKQEKAGYDISNEQLQEYRNSLVSKQNAFLAQLEAQGINYELDGVDIKDFDGNTAKRADYRFSLVLNGVTLKIPASAVGVIRSMPEVKKVEPNVNLSIDLGKSVPYVKAPEVYGQVAELTQFDNHREGFEGQGINIAVLDTGIDWAHPMFGGDPTPPRLGVAPFTAATNYNQKVIYYLSFSGGLIDDFGHGTHASSNAAGYKATAPGKDGIPLTADDENIHGVAPQARLMGYKVCTGTGSCVSASTILGIEDAVSPTTLTLQPKPVAHVINMSLGGTGTPDSATALAADAAALMGTTVVASAGNSGPGESTIGAPSTGRHVISVAATTHPGAANANWSVDVLKANAVPGNQVGAVTPARNLAAEDGFGRIKLYPMAGTPDPAAGSIAQRYSLVNIVTVTSSYPASVRGRIALVKRSAVSSATFAQICNDAGLNGAVGMVLISTTTNPTALKGTIPCAIVAPADGDILIDAMSSTDDNAVDPPNGTVSELLIRINPFLTDVFVGETAGFSSRGPVAGLGQVKPDVTAPGVGIIGATVRAGAATTGGGTMFNPTGYIAANGTSFSGPHVAGTVALIKQAHLNWTPDMIRTALINTSTNMRRTDNTAKADGNSSDSVLEQGGGLINVPAAIFAKSIMGVTADGITLPGILGSHSFGETAILNNRVLNQKEVTVTIRDTSGEGGTYNLSVADNRQTERDGITPSVSQSTVSVPANGEATFKAKIALDGDKIRDESTIQLQWYVVAKRQGSNETLRMPMYLRATPSLPSNAISNSETTTYTGTVLASDAGTQRDNDLYLLEDVSYVDVPFEADAATAKISATLNWDIAASSPEAGAGVPDLDFLLFDPNGNEIGSSGNGDTIEHIEADATIPGTYIYRVYGWANGPTDFEVESTLLKGSAAPVVQQFAADFVNNGTRFDFDGNYTLSWQPQGGVEKYEIEESVNGGNWSVVRTVDGNATSTAFENISDGTRSYRIRSITPGLIGKYVTAPSNVESITVSKRAEINATDAIALVNKSIVFAGGKTDLSSALKNESTTVFYPNTYLDIVSVESAGNSVRVENAANGKDGVKGIAVFDYSQSTGNSFAPGAESSPQLIRFSNPNTVLFTFTVRVRSNVLTGNSGGTSGSPSGTSGGTSGGESSGSGGTSTSSSTGGTSLLKFTVNPLTKTVSLLK